MTHIRSHVNGTVDITQSTAKLKIDAKGTLKYRPLTLHFQQIAQQLNGSVKEPNISMYFFFQPITQRCSISNVLFTGGRGGECQILLF